MQDNTYLHDEGVVRMLIFDPVFTADKIEN